MENAYTIGQRVRLTRVSTSSVRGELATVIGIKGDHIRVEVISDRARGNVLPSEVDPA